MITIIFYAINKSRANEPQKNHHVLRRAFEGPILAHDDFFAHAVREIGLLLYLGYRCPGPFYR